MMPVHPFAPFSYRAGLTALLAGLCAVVLWWLEPSGFTADFAGLLLAYALVVGLLEPARRWRHGAVLAAWTAAALTVGGLLGNWVSNRLIAHALSTGRWHADLAAYISAALCVLILPGLVRRWLTWREARLLAEQAERLGAERALLEARLAALQGQIEPHFLYNTLANVQYLVRRDNERADQMLERLIAYLRAAVPELRQSETTLGQELDRTRAYLDIMAIRMGERLRYRVFCPVELEPASLPPLALATLVENALKHGLEPKQGGGEIDIEVIREGDALHIEVRDDGVGFRETARPGGVGLRNLTERLHTQFGDAAGLVLEARAEGGVTARLRLPLRIDPADNRVV